MFNPRKRVLRKLGALFESLRTLLVPVGTDGLKFRQLRLERQGWIWFIFPRLVLKELGDIDLVQSSKQAIESVQSSVDELAKASREEIRGAVKRSVNYRATQVQTRFGEKLDEMVAGSEQLPSAIVSKGRGAVQAVHRSIVEAAGQAASAHFEQALRKTLAQMLAYAREEAGGEPPTQVAFPQGTRFVYYGDPYTLYIIEEQPRVRTILWDDTQVMLSFPYVVFPLYLKNGKFEAMQMFFRNEPLLNPSDHLFAPPLPDIMEYVTRDGEVLKQLRYKYWVCFPGPKVSQGAPADVAKSAQQVFWSSNFRSDHWSRTLRDKLKGMEGFSTDVWRKLSTEAPLDIMRTSWLETPYTVDMLGSDLKRPATAFKPIESMSKLERYVHELSGRVGTSIQEVVLNAISDSNGPAAARAMFDTKLRDAVNEAQLAERVGTLVREELMNACNDAEAETVVATVAKKASVKLVEIITPAMDTAVSLMAEQLRGTPNEKE